MSIWQLSSGRRVALKVMIVNPDEHQGLQRFRREADLLHQVHHPSVIQLIECDTEASPPWMAFEYLERPRALNRWLAEEQPPLARSMALMCQVASGLGA